MSVLCDFFLFFVFFDATDAGGRETTGGRVRFESERVSLEGSEVGGREDREEGGGAGRLGGGWHSPHRPLAESGSFYIMAR